MLYFTEFKNELVTNSSFPQTLTYSGLEHKGFSAVRIVVIHPLPPRLESFSRLHDLPMSLQKFKKMHQPKLWETLRSRVKSFQNAGRGVVILFQHETNARIQLTAFIASILLGLFSSLSTREWVSILLASAMVLMGEALNSALEKACDAITIDPHPSIRDAKDLAAGAVLLASCFALLVGCLIFIPKWFPTILNIVR